MNIPEFTFTLHLPSNRSLTFYQIADNYLIIDIIHSKNKISYGKPGYVNNERKTKNRAPS